MSEVDTGRRERLMKEKVETAIHVSMGDVDVSRIHFASVFSYIDRNESILFSKLGLAISEMLRSGFALPVVSTQCDYKQPFGLDDLVTISSSISNIGTKSLKVSHQILDLDGEILAEAYTVHVSIREEMNAAISVEELLDGMQI